MITHDDYVKKSYEKLWTKTSRELKVLARYLKLKGFSKLNKSELVIAIKNRLQNRLRYIEG